MKFLRNFTKSKAALLTLLMSVPFTASAGHSSLQRANFMDFPAGADTVGGAATLIRTRFELRANMAFKDLEAGATYTVWWAVFNKPENCVNGPGFCGLPDLQNAAAELAIYYGAGFIADANGQANLFSHTRAGSVPDGTDNLIPGTLQKGNGMHAEVMLMVRTHGQPIHGKIDEQIGSYGGGCDINTCAETHSASFPPADL